MLSVIIIAKNEQGVIKNCLESIRWADEILVFDKGSTDQTVEIARSYTNNIIKVKDADFATTHNEVIKYAKGGWVLYIDPDERVLDDLKQEIIEITKKDNDFSAFAISRKNIIFGREEKYGPFWPDWVIRLIKKTDFETWIGKVHEYPKFRGKVGYTKHSLLHLTHRNVDQFINKMMAWSRIEAELRIEANHPKMTKWRFIRIFITELINQGIKRRGFFADTIGLIDSMLQTFHLFITYVRLWELQQNKPLDETYKQIDKKLLENNFKY